MNITKENIDDLNAVLNLQLVQEDYQERVEAVLKDYKKKAKIDGFRPGKVPFGLINKMYGKPVKIEEINKLVSESIAKYLIDEKLNILGEPMPHEGERKEIDWDNDTEFEFKFDLGIAPELDFKLTARDKVTKYNIQPDDQLIDKFVDSYCQRFGSFSQEKEVAEKDVVKADIAQLDDQGNILDGGISVEEASVAVDVIKDKKIKEQFIGAKQGDTLSFDLRKAYPSDAEIAGMLKIDKEMAAGLTSDFQVTIKEIQRFAAAEVNQELFDKVYGEGIVNSVEEFRNKIKEEAEVGLKNDSEYKFRLDAKAALIKKFKKELPRDFLKRWLFAINEGKFSQEQIEEEFSSFEDDLKWQLIKDKLKGDNNIEVSEEDIKSAAKEMALMQFRQYGMNEVPEEHLESFAARILENKEEARKVHERKLEDKVLEHIKTVVKIDEKDITAEKFNKLLEN